MQSPYAKAIRAARTAAGLTQPELGKHIGVNGKAICRWERGECGPTRRNRAALLTAISLCNAEAGAQLRAAFAGTPSAEAARAVVATPAPASQDVSVQLAFLAFVHALDVPPRRARSALVRLCKQLRGAGLSVEALGTCMERVLPEDEATGASVPN